VKNQPSSIAKAVAPLVLLFLVALPTLGAVIPSESKRFISGRYSDQAPLLVGWRGRYSPVRRETISHYLLLPSFKVVAVTLKNEEAPTVKESIFGSLVYAGVVLFTLICIWRLHIRSPKRVTP